MFKKIALATAIAAIASSAFAMEALDEETLSATTGQAGLTISMGSNLSVQHLRYTDTDGITAAQAATWTPAVVAGYNNRGTLDVANLAISATNITLDLDVGSTTGADTTLGTADDVTSLFVSQSITGLNVSIGQLTLDSDDVLRTGGALNSRSFGALNLSDVTLSNSKMRITPGGATGAQGVTIANGGGLANISLDFEYIDDGNSLSLGGATGNAADQGINIVGLDQGTTQIDVVAGGLQLTTGAMTIQSVQLGGSTGIQMAGQSIGQVALLGVTVGANTITVRGH